MTRCYGCEQEKTKPEVVEKLPSVVFYAPIAMPGIPTLEGHRLGAEMVASYAWHHGIDEVCETYDLSRADVLVCCWWAGMFHTRAWKKRWGEWAQMAFNHLWHSCVQIADPPRKEVTR